MSYNEITDRPPASKLHEEVADEKYTLTAQWKLISISLSVPGDTESVNWTLALALAKRYAHALFA